MAEEQTPNEMTAWKVPHRWGRYLYLGTIGVLLLVLKIMGNINSDLRKDLDNCIQDNRAMTTEFNNKLYNWANRVFESNIDKAKQEKFDPEMNEVKRTLDSIKNVKL